MYCSNCGRMLADNQRFCSICGVETLLVDTTQSTYIQTQQTYAFSGYCSAEVETLVNKKREYYIPKFYEMKSQNKTVTWNWAAFFWAPFWLFYRKMYGFGIAYLSTSFLFYIARRSFPMFSSPKLLSAQVITEILSLAVNLVLTLFANYIYMQWVEKNADQAKGLSEPKKTEFIQKRGGTSVVAVVIACVGWYLLSYLITTI